MPIISQNNAKQKLLLQLNANSNKNLFITPTKPIIPYNNNCYHSEYQAAKKNHRTSRNHSGNTYSYVNWRNNIDYNSIKSYNDINTKLHGRTNSRLDKVIESINNETSDDEINNKNITKKINNTINIISPSKTIRNNSINNNIFSASNNFKIHNTNLSSFPHKIFNNFQNNIDNNTVRTTNHGKTTISKAEKIISPNKNITQTSNIKCKVNDNNIKTPVIQNKSLKSTNIMNTNDTTPYKRNNNADINNDNTNLQDSNNITSDKKNISKNLLFY